MNIRDVKADLVKWALSIILKRKDEGLYGTLTFFYENGKIIRSETKSSEKPVLH